MSILRIEALHLSYNRPYMLEDRWVCLDTVPEIRDVDLKIQSANEWLVINRPYSRCDLRFYAISADQTMSEILGAKIGDALLLIERSTWIDEAHITTVKTKTTPGYQLLTSS